MENNIYLTNKELAHIIISLYGDIYQMKNTLLGEKCGSQRKDIIKIYEDKLNFLNALREKLDDSVKL
jgi:hypothetical protein